ncbi:MAG: 2-oxo acid dehydrogenase subunit E2 [Microbacteriaceae bacterium]|nr:MAG: 2-oxo acid dehydrogenase subunit E2 [Microbacteriaceae bacterium]
MIEITMPRLSDTMEEGAIATWHKQPGDRVEVGDILVEIETDKATMEYEAYEAGTMSKILVAEGENVSIGTPIALIDDGTDAAAPATPVAATPTADATRRSNSEAYRDQETTEPGLDTRAPSSLVTRPTEDGRPVEDVADGERRFASPYVRKLARDNNLDLSKVRGTGPGGRIIRTDLDGLLAPGAEAAQAAAQAASAAGAPAAPAAPPAPAAATRSSAGAAQAGGAPAAMPAPTSADEKRASESVAMTKTRRVIARRLGESARTIPHFFVTAVADAEALMQLRADLNTQLTASGRPKVSVNDLLIRASALALREHPLVNASYIDDTSDTMQVHHRVNIGVAVASENGLVVPVITDADTKTVTQLGAETKQLVALANDKKLSLEQISGGTFTISNLGMFGVEQFTAIINPPEGAILAVGGTKREPTVVGDEILPRYRMRYTLSADHRIVDGALAAQFLQTLTRLIENPWAIIA